MAAHVIKLDAEHLESGALKAPAECIRKGGLVVFPTETVYGIAARGDDPKAIARLLEVRNSPKEKLLTVHIADAADVKKYVPSPLSPMVQRLMRRFWPGPLTLVFPTADGQGVGLRYPNHKVACELIRQAGVKVVAPSANLMGHPPAYEAQSTIETFADKVDTIIDAGPTRYQKSSTVVRISERRVEVLREGAIPKSVIDEKAYLSIVFVCTGNTCRSPMAEAMLKKMLARKYGFEVDELELHGFRIQSSGTAAGIRIGVPDEVRQAVEERGFRLDNHVSQPLTVSMIEEADVIFAMSKRHQETILEWLPECAERLFLLDPEGNDIEDPIGGTLETYRTCAQKIKRSIETRLKSF